MQTGLEKKTGPDFRGGLAGEREERIRLLRAEADLREMERVSGRL